MVFLARDLKEGSEPRSYWKWSLGDIFVLPGRVKDKVYRDQGRNVSDKSSLCGIEYLIEPLRTNLNEILSGLRLVLTKTSCGVGVALCHSSIQKGLEGRNRQKINRAPLVCFGLIGEADPGMKSPFANHNPKI